MEIKDNISLEDSIMARRGPRKGWNIAKAVIGMGCGMCATYAATQVLTPFVIATLPQTGSVILDKAVKGASYVGTSVICGTIGTAIMKDATEALDSVEWIYDAARVAMEARSSEAEDKMAKLHEQFAMNEEA